MKIDTVAVQFTKLLGLRECRPKLGHVKIVAVKTRPSGCSGLGNLGFSIARLRKLLPVEELLPLRNYCPVEGLERRGEFVASPGIRTFPIGKRQRGRSRAAVC